MSNEEGATLMGQQLSIEGVDSIHGGMSIAQAREAQGLSLDDLSAKLKVSVRKLEQIERGEFDKISGGDAHVRGLVRAVCKAVGVQPEPILQQLPAKAATMLPETMDTRFETPFATSGRLGKLGYGPVPAKSGGGGAARVKKLPAIGTISNAWIAGALIASVAAIVLYAWPAIQPQAEKALSGISSIASSVASSAGGKIAEVSKRADADKADKSAQTAKANTAGTVTTEVKSGSTEMPPGVTSNVTIAPGEAGALNPTAAASTAAAEAAATFKPSSTSSAPAQASAIDDTKLVIKASAPTWVEIRGISGTVLASRSLATGEQLEQGLERRRSVVIGNASGVQVWVRGKAYDVMSQASGNNVARFDIE